jgi:hypothetical protein
MERQNEYRVSEVKPGYGMSHLLVKSDAFASTVNTANAESDCVCRVSFKQLVGWSGFALS